MFVGARAVGVPKRDARLKRDIDELRKRTSAPRMTVERLIRVR